MAPAAVTFIQNPALEDPEREDDDVRPDSPVMPPEAEASATAVRYRDSPY